jgi:hypothetical protein
LGDALLRCRDQPSALSQTSDPQVLELEHDSKQAPNSWLNGKQAVPEAHAGPQLSVTVGSVGQSA